MKFVGIRDFRAKAASVLKELETEQEIVLTSNGKPVAILSAVSEDNLEANLRAFRRARAVAAVASLQHSSARRGMDRITPQEIEAEIANVRANRPQ